jgi:hypothetical protein
VSGYFDNPGDLEAVPTDVTGSDAEATYMTLNPVILTSTLGQ